MSGVEGAIPLSLPVVLVPHPHVRVNPQVLGGSPHVSGSRVPVRRLWTFYRRGTKVETLIKRFPQLAVRMFRHNSNDNEVQL